MEALGGAASVIAVIQIVGQITSVTYNFISGVREASKVLGKLVVELASLSNVLIILQDYTDRNKGFIALKQLEKTLRKCAEELKTLHLKLSRTGLIDKFKWPLREKDTMRQIDQIERYKSLFALALSADQASLSKAIATYAEDTNLIVHNLQANFQSEASAQSLHRQKEDARQLAEKRQKILSWLYPGSFDRRHSEICKRRQSNTGGWLPRKHEFGEWVEGLASRLLWGYGIPGAGKTFISSVAIEHLHSLAETKNYGVAYTYFDYKEQDSQKPTHVLASLVKQLSIQKSGSDIPAEVEKLYDTLEPKSKEPSLEELYETLVAISGSFTKVFIVPDALDECHQINQRKELLPLIHRLGQSGINLFLTSRQYPVDIQDSFCNASKIEIVAHQEDLEIYIEEKIDDNPRAKKLVLKTKCKERIISELIECSKGMFLLVHFHVEFLCQQMTARQMLEALGKLKSSRKGKISVYPTYDRVMDTIRRQDSTCVDLALRVLSWLVKARRTLTIRELQTAVSVEPGMTELDNDLDLPDGLTLLDVCSGLVTIDESSKTIQLAHYTVQEYLVKNDIIAQKAEFNLAMSCITFLSFDAFVKGVCTTWDRYKARIDSHPFLRYAALYLGSHINACNEDLTANMVLAFAKSPGSLSSYQQIFQGRFDTGPADFTRTLSKFDGFTKHFPLQQLSEWGHCTAAQSLLDKDTNHVLMKEGPSALRIAANIGNVAICRLLLEKGVDISVLDERGWAVLDDAASNGKNSIVSLLLEKGANPSLQDKRGETALYRAVSRGQDEVAQLMLQMLQGANSLVTGSFKNAVLISAAARGSSEVVKLLLETNIDVSIRNPGEGLHAGQTALDAAIIGGHYDIVSLLLEKGALHSSLNHLGETPLHLASKKGHEPIVRLLLEKGADISIRDNLGHTPLNHAAVTGDKATVQLLLKEGADFTVCGKDSFTPLHLAAGYGRESAVRLLLENGADISATNSTNRTPLFVAAMNGHEAVVQLLLDNGADLSISNTNGATPLHVAAQQGHEPVVRLLLEKRADISATRSDNCIPLYLAAMNGHEAVVQLLLDSGADLSISNTNGATPLHVAAQQGHEPVVRLLLENGADISAAASGNRTPLYSAASNGHKEVVQLLLENGADISAADSTNCTPLLLAASNGHEPVVRLLLKNGAEVSIANSDNDTPIHAAAFEGYEEVVQLLLENGADPSIVNTAGGTPLLAAAQGGHEPVVRLLLENGADPSIVDTAGATPLHAAAQGGHELVVRLLLENGADISAADSTNRTPLFVAVTNGHEAVVQLLLDNGADLSTSGPKTFLPLHSAALRGNKAITHLLLEAGADTSAICVSGETALHIATSHYHLGVVQLLLAKGALSSIPDGFGRTARDIANLSKSDALIKLFETAMPNEIALK